MTKPPLSINAIRAEHLVEITWEPEHVGRYPNRLLRISCRCASCVNEFTGEPILDPATVPDDIGINAMEAVGNYAIKFSYSDGHDTGILSWDRLRELCPCDRCRSVPLL